MSFFYSSKLNIAYKGEWAKSHMLKWLADLVHCVNLQVESDLQGRCHLCRTQHLICSSWFLFLFLIKPPFFPRGQANSLTPEPGVLRLTLGWKSHSMLYVLMVCGGFISIYLLTFLPAPLVLYSLPIQGQNFRDCLICPFAVFGFPFNYCLVCFLRHDGEPVPSKKTVVLVRSFWFFLISLDFSLPTQGKAGADSSLALVLRTHSRVQCLVFTAVSSSVF